MEISIDHPEALQTETINSAERLCLDFFDDVWARGNTDRLSHYLAPDFSFNPPPGFPSDINGYAALVEAIHHGLPDLFADIEELVVQDDCVAAKWVVEGTHKNELMGIPATGNRIHMEGLALDWVKDGRICKAFETNNQLEMLAQMGVTDLGQLADPKGPWWPED